jgi:hypothetical protein
MRECLHLLEPPPRKVLVQDVKVKDPKLLERLEQAKEITKRAESSKLIYRLVLKWYRRRFAGRALMRAVQLAHQKEKEKNAHNVDDDLWSYGGHSTGGFSSYSK